MVDLLERLNAECPGVVTFRTTRRGSIRNKRLSIIFLRFWQVPAKRKIQQAGARLTMYQQVAQISNNARAKQRRVAKEYKNVVRPVSR